MPQNLYAQMLNKSSMHQFYYHMLKNAAFSKNAENHIFLKNSSSYCFF